MPSPRNSVRRDSTPEPSRTRAWVFGGLAVPKGVIVARRSRPRRLPLNSKVVLVGDEHALGVGQFLGKLAVDHGVNLRFEWERGQLFERWYRPDKTEQIARAKPGLLLVMFGSAAPQDALVPKLHEFVRLMKPTPIRWVLPLDVGRRGNLPEALAETRVDVLDPSRVAVSASHTGAPSARMHAGLAGAIWNWIR